MKEFTASSFAQAIGTEKDEAYNLLRFLVAKGFAENLGARQAPGKKGRGETHYRIKDTAPKGVFDILKAAL